MGKKGPRRGSLAYWHRQRASRIVPRMRFWGANGKGLMGFPGFKAGMTQASVVEDEESPLKGQEIVVPVTVVEVPPIFVHSVVFYEKRFDGLKRVGEIVSTASPKAFSRLGKPAVKAGKSFDDFDAGKLADVRLVVAAMPDRTGIGGKKPLLFECGLGGSMEEKLAFGREFLGKDVSPDKFFSEGMFVDVIGVTKGKGWQGVVKRFGVALNIHKATQKRRHGGSIGPERQAKVMYTVPRAGQMGFHKRTDVNKRVLMLSNDAGLVSKTKAFRNYGLLKSWFVALMGSVPGPAKRVLVLRKSVEDKAFSKPEVKGFRAV